MKKSLISLMLVLLLVNIVYAGSTYDLDFEKSPTYSVGLLEGDRVSFESNNSRHTILLKESSPGKADLAIFTYLDIQNNERVPFYVVVTEKSYLKLDLNRDSKDDLNVFYQSSNNTAALLLFQLPVIINKDLEIFPKSSFNNNLKYFLYIVVPVIILILVLFFINMFFKKKEDQVVQESQENKNN